MPVASENFFASASSYGAPGPSAPPIHLIVAPLRSVRRPCGTTIVLPAPVEGAAAPPAAAVGCAAPPAAAVGCAAPPAAAVAAPPPPAAGACVVVVAPPPPPPH